jgi:hypothetical protein
LCVIGIFAILIYSIYRKKSPARLQNSKLVTRATEERRKMRWYHWSMEGWKYIYLATTITNKQRGKSSSIARIHAVRTTSGVTAPGDGSASTRGDRRFAPNSNKGEHAGGRRCENLCTSLHVGNKVMQLSWTLLPVHRTTSLHARSKVVPLDTVLKKR